MSGAQDSSFLEQYLDLIRGSLEEVKKKLAEYDADHKVSEKASQYFATALDKAHAALAELRRVTEQVKSNPKDLSVWAATNALTSASAALQQLSETAKQYDETFKLSSRVSTIVLIPKEQAFAAVASIGAYIAHVSDTANAQLQGVSHGLRAKLAEVASAGLERALPQAVKADEMLHFSEAAAKTKELILVTTKDLDQKFGILNIINQAAGQAQSWDQKLTGGRLGSAYSLGWAMVGSVQEKYEEKKKEMARPTTSGGSA